MAHPGDQRTMNPMVIQSTTALTAEAEATTALGMATAGAARAAGSRGGRAAASRWLQVMLGVLLIVSVGLLLYRLQGSQPIHQVKVIGQLKHLDRGALKAVINRQLGHSWLTLAADEIHQEVIALPWVKQGAVRIVWPDSLEVEISERKAVARWGAGALLDADGELFTPASIDRFSAWPRLEGPPGSEQRLLAAWRRLTVAFEVFQVALRELRLLADGEWEMLTDEGLVLITDSSDPASVVITYGDAMVNTFGADFAGVERIDFRYANGFAVTYKADRRSAR